MNFYFMFYGNLYNRVNKFPSQLFRNISNSSLRLCQKGNECFINSKILKNEVHPKSLLQNIYSIVSNKLGSEKLKPVYKYMHVEGKTQEWKAKVTLHWPSTFTEEGVAKRKKFAEGIAASRAIEWLRKQKVLDKNNYPIMYTKEEKNLLIQSSTKFTVNISSEVEEKVKYFLNDYRDIKTSLINDNHDKSTIEAEFAEDDKDANYKSVEVETDVMDVITGRKLKEFEPEDIYTKSFRMNFKMKKMETLHEYLNMKEQRDLLPISKKREEILSLIKNNPVIVLSGETGCGKTTQVPQFILDEYIKCMEGAKCNIVVTQPRRISAISIASRVAQERCEKVGDTIGFKVRLNQMLPKKNGAVLFCTTGILLNSLQSNPSLIGISHIIVDEVHERNVQTDFLLMILKTVLKENKDLKVILMSATINAKLFSEYFDNCPIINVPGFTYPVKEYYLTDVKKQITRNDISVEEKPIINAELIVNLIEMIDKSRPSGAILCFLPGWQEIKTINSMLQNIKKSHYQIYLLHSLIPHHKQTGVFDPAPANIRKIILATNIAETSITINDVIYIIDPGCHRELKHNTSKGISVLQTQWVSKANVKQRTGRAGRVQPGECFHLFPEGVLNDMDEYQTPEILRISLENLVLDSKLYCPNMSIKEFLSQAIEAPSAENIESAVKNLQQLDILDNEENLTLLGKYVAFFPTHPRLSKAIVLSAVFRCIDPVLTIASMLTAGKDPFELSLIDNATVREIKKKYNMSYSSDYLSFVNLFNTWDRIESIEENQEFCKINNINVQIMKFIKGLKYLFVEHLLESGLVKNAESCSDLNSVYNQYSTDIPTIMCALCSALYPNVLKLKQGILQNGRINWNKNTIRTLDGKRARIVGHSVLAKETKFLSPWIIYFNGLQMHERGFIAIRDASVIPGMILFLCAGRNIQKIRNDDEDNGAVSIMVDNIKTLSLTSSMDQCNFLMDLRECLHNVIQWSLATCDSEKNDKTTIHIFVNKFLQILSQLLKSEEVSNCNKIS